MTDSITSSLAAATVDDEKIGREEVALNEAFDPLPPDIAWLEMPDARLRGVVPTPPPVAFDELEQESLAHRVLFLRHGAVIAVTTLVSIGGALFIHSLFAGVFILGTFFGFPTVHGDGNGGESANEGGASPEGYMMMSDASSSEMRGPLASLGKPDASLLALPAPAQLPALPEVSSAEVAVRQLQTSFPPVPVPMTSDMGTVKVSPPARAAAGPENLVVNPSAATGLPTGVNAVASASRGQSVEGAESGDGEERVFSLFKGDGAGKGKGSGHGNGIDRGLSAANSEAQLLLPPAFSLPLQYQLKPPPHSTKLEITVLADGAVGDIRVAQSCGIRELDESLALLARTSFRFRPAFRAGKAVQSVFEFQQDF